MGRPRKNSADKRRQIKPYVSPETEANIRAGIGLKALGKILDDTYGDSDD